MEENTVVGHIVSSNCGWIPALEQSTELFQAVVSDDISKLETLFDASTCLTTGVPVLYWGADKKVEVKSRTLAMLAAQHGSLRVLSFLLSKGADPKQMSIDGLTCYELIDSTNVNAPTIRAMLDDAAGNFLANTSEAPATGPVAAEALSNATLVQPNYAQQEGEGDLDSLPYSTADLVRPEYSTDTFRMYCFKVLRCTKRYAHDWRACPFAHPTENARRRDPREFRYSSLVCPDYRQGCCVRGDSCQYAHGVFESWLHPSRYRTQLCKDQEKCDRPVCFFAHTITELRSPVDTFVPHPDERLAMPEAMKMALGITAPAALMTGPGSAALAAALPQDTAGLSQDQDVTTELKPPGQRLSASSSSIGTSGGGGGSAVPYSSSSSGGGSSAGNSSGGTSTATSSSGGALLVAGTGSTAGEASGTFDRQDSSGSGGGTSGSLRPNKQLLAPGAVPMPRMSNAFARKHGLNPKDNPLVNLQRIAMQQVAPTASAAAATGNGRRPRRGRQQQQQQQQQQLLPQPVLPPPVPMQPAPHPHQFMHPPLSPAAAAATAYYTSPAAHLLPQQSHTLQAAAPNPVLDSQAMALLFGGMTLNSPPLSPANLAAAAASGNMAAAAAAAQGYPVTAQHQPLSSMAIYGMTAAAPAGAMGLPGAAVLSSAALGPSGLGPPSPLGQPGLHVSTGLQSPQPPQF